MRSAVLLITFNRPDTTAQVFAAIRRARPPRLYIASDGPRVGRTDDAPKIAAVRALVNEVDWTCDVRTLFHDRNMGCRRGPAGAIDWFFEHESEGIILEDDCVPLTTFFPFCDDLLERFRDDERIAQICGSAFIPSPRPERDYWFSKYADIWGWATWRRAWRHANLDMTVWPAWRAERRLSYLPGSTPAFIDYWTHLFDATYDGRLDDCWDFQWMLTCWNQGWLSVVPRVSQVTNVGFGADATHTKGYDLTNPAVQAQAQPMRFPLRHNEDLCTHPSAERLHGRVRYSLSRASEMAARTRRIPLVGDVAVRAAKRIRMLLRGAD